MVKVEQREITDYARAVSAEIRSLLGIKQVTKARVAEHLGVSSTYLHRRLNDVQAFSLDDIQLIASVLGVDYRDLLLLRSHPDSNNGWKQPARMEK